MGFTKYHDEINRYQLSSSLPSNGLPNTGLPTTYQGSNSQNNTSNIARSQSLSSGAGQAAMAALRMHSLPQHTPSNQPQSAAFRRSNSLTINSNNRSNSLRSYTYNPKPSYVAGQSVNRGQPLRSPAQPRSYSLTSQPGRSYGSQRVSSINSRTPMPINELEEDAELEDAVITTQTTKMVDAQGRLTLITTKTIKTYADGSKEIETTKRNISRSGSRTNSLTAAPRNNSILSAGGTAYNLSKIDEDLRDFDYNYEEEGLTLNQGLGEPLKSLDLASKIPPRDHSAERRRDELRSLESSPSKPLRSILKNTLRPNFSPEGESLENVEEPAGPAIAADPLTPNMSPTLNQKPFQPPSLSQPPKIKVPATPDASHLDHRSLLSSQVSPSAYSSSHRDYTPPHKRQSSSPNSSIKFVSKVETIPIPRSEPKQLTEQELYAKAMEVAMQNVYGTKEDPEASGIDSKGDVKKLVVKDATKRNTIAASTPGVSDNYVYQNHHKEFPAHSMRSGDTKLTSRKERVKEEKKRIKAQEKEEKQQKKLEEKEKKEEEKEFTKKPQEVEKEKKKQEKKPLREFFFGRRKSASHEVNQTTPLPQALEDPVKTTTEADTNAGNTSHLLPGSFLTSPDSETLPQFVNHDAQDRAASLVETMPESIPDTEPLPAPTTHLVAEPLPKQSETSQDDVIASTTASTRKLNDPSEPTENLNSAPQDILVDVPSIEEQAVDLPSPEGDTELIEVPVLNEVASLSSQDEDELVDETATARTSLDPWVGSGSLPLHTFTSKVQGTSEETFEKEPNEQDKSPVVIENLAASSPSEANQENEKLLIPETVPLSADEHSEKVFDNLEIEPHESIEADAGEPAAPIPTTRTSESVERYNDDSMVAHSSESGVTAKPELLTRTSAEVIPAPIAATRTPEEPAEPVPTVLTSEETISSHHGLNEESLDKFGPGLQEQTNGTLDNDSSNPIVETHQPGDENEKVSSPSIEVNSRGERKKKNKFKHKLFKYFINSYDK